MKRYLPVCLVLALWPAAPERSVAAPDPEALRRNLTEGTLEPNAGVPNGASALIDAQVFGLKGLIAATASAAAQNPTGDTKFGDVAGFLFVLKALGQRETGTDGVPVDLFAVEMTDEGQMRLDGKPLEESLTPGAR